MRNLAWKVFSDVARRHIDFRNYIFAGDVWIPHNLKQGDIIRADIPTDVNGDGNLEICPRNCLVLGVDIDPINMTLQAIRVMKLSYQVNDASELGHEIFLDTEDKILRSKLGGLRRPAILRTGTVEILEPNSANFGFCMDRIGRFHEDLFPMIQEAIHRGYENVRHRKSDDTPLSRGIGKTIFVSGIEPSTWSESDVFRLTEAEIDHNLNHGYNFRQMPAQEQAALAEKMELEMPYLILESQYQRFIDIGRNRALSKIEKETMRANQKLRASMRRGYSHSHGSKTDMLELINTAMREFKEDQIGLSTFDIDTRSRPLFSIPDLEELLKRRFGFLEQGNDSALSLSSQFIKQSIDPDSLRDLETLGIGGLKREASVELPKQLWRGRYIMMRIPNLMDSEDQSEFVYRPCALWKAYAKMDADGMPVLAGMELHPCTRGSAHLFSHKMKVRPLDTTVPVPSYLIADLQIRADISAQFLQPIQPRVGTFFELLPHMVESFDIKRDLAAQSDAGIKTFGLTEVPHDWIEIDLPEPPNEKLRRSLQRNQLRFV
jgi:hypothetical protein